MHSVHRRCSSGSPLSGSRRTPPCLVPKQLSRPGERFASETSLALGVRRRSSARVSRGDPLSTFPPGPRATRASMVQEPKRGRAARSQGWRLIPMLLPSAYRIGSPMCRRGIDPGLLVPAPPSTPEPPSRSRAGFPLNTPHSSTWSSAIVGRPSTSLRCSSGNVSPSRMSLHMWPPSWRHIHREPSLAPGGTPQIRGCFRRPNSECRGHSADICGHFSTKVLVRG